MISTAPIDWRRFSPQNASVFELQNLCIALKPGWRNCMSLHSHTCKHTNRKKRSFVSGNFKDDTICSVYCTEGNKDTYKWACTVCTVACILDCLSAIGRHACPPFFFLPWTPRPIICHKTISKAHYSSILFMLCSNTVTPKNIGQTQPKNRWCFIA